MTAGRNVQSNKKVTLLIHTAESIAEIKPRPLYSVSGGELCDSVYDIERKLREIFDLAKRWGAVVLLDEADVVMARRSSFDLNRNAIVAGKFSHVIGG